MWGGKGDSKDDAKEVQSGMSILCFFYNFCSCEGSLVNQKPKLILACDSQQPGQPEFAAHGQPGLRPRDLGDRNIDRYIYI